LTKTGHFLLCSRATGANATTAKIQLATKMHKQRKTLAVSRAAFLAAS
jgi:hypothetical protein